MVASALGFSSALGAFLMGAFLGESDEAAKSIRYLKPIRDLFGAIFFTSVGTLVDIYLVYSEVWLVLLLSAITIMGKVFSTAGGAMISRKDKNTAFQVGLSLGQIGEFSFIIATLGLNNNVIRKDLYPLTVAIALITTFATPYLVMVANKIGIK
jgi:CPA2 family monovalent cation:H+ antiporter-2